MTDPDDGDRRYDEIKNGDRPAPPFLRERFRGRFREYPAIDADAPRPSNRDVSAGGEPSPAAGPKAEAAHAGTGTGMPSDCEGLHREGEGNRNEAGAGDRAGEPSPAVLL